MSGWRSRFVDRRTSVLMRRLRENATMEADITATGDVTVEGQHVGHLHGFQFVPDPQADGTEAKTLRNAAAKALAGEIEARAERFSAAADTSLVLSNDGVVRWLGDPVAKLEPGDKIFEPRLRILADEQLTGPARDKVDARLEAWLKAHIVRLLGPLLQLGESAELTGLARGIGFQVAEALGVLERSKVLQEVRGLDQDGRAALRRQGVRFGAYHLYLPALLKPAARILAAQLWALQNGGLDQKGIDDIAHLAGSGRTSIPVDPEIAKGLYRAAGFRVCGGRAVRVDILERLADLIRPAIAYRPGVTPGEPPPGAADARRLRGDDVHDLARRLLGRGFRLDPEIARLRHGAPSRPRHHDAARSGAAAPGAWFERRRKRDAGGCRAGGGGRRKTARSPATPPCRSSGGGCGRFFFTGRAGGPRLIHPGRPRRWRRRRELPLRRPLKRRPRAEPKSRKPSASSSPSSPAGEPATRGG